ncbi:glycosyltransferase family 2 protein [Leifsonia poae]|uniref:glycosyltransferase family 2 protein n=1 Tax=Leifsonia poae TaxID=110933 RepID=UPI001CC19178|nr:glycosyltransferase family 2 protein [Leifsonia poae]
MTLMVRDEADVIGQMVEHHLAQGVDRIIVTDNGSVDGTREILADERWADRLDVRDDPRHLKQQHTTVTAMARDAFELYGADWVINADADEFWFAVDRSQSLHEAFAAIPQEFQTFPVTVTDMIGPPALRGSGLHRLAYRDLRPVERMNEIGILNHATPDAVHIGTNDIVVAQGNHFVNLESKGRPAEGAGIEVLHFPWRSWEQFQRKVRASGAAYARNPELTPSPNHHGMREYARERNGVLFSFYVARHPSDTELREGIANGTLVADERMGATVESVPDVPLDVSAEADELHRTFARAYAAKESADAAELTELLRRTEVFDRTQALEEQLRQAREQVATLEGLVDRFSARRIVRTADALSAASASVRRAVGARAARRIAEAEEARRRQRDDERFTRMRSLLSDRISPALVRGEVSNDALPIMMCLWNRPERIQAILDMLSRQSSPTPVRLILWNNDPRNQELYERVIAEHSLGSLASVELYASPHNIGGIGRFVVARYLWEDGVRGPFIMLDDDQDVTAEFTREMTDAYSPRRVAAWWAFRNHGSYWNRSEIDPNEPADHAGTGGTVIDIDLVDDLAFFGIDPRYLMLEDQWMTHVAAKRNWDVRKAKVAIDQVMDLEENNQYHALLPLKDEFYAFLHGQV